MRKTILKTATIIICITMTAMTVSGLIFGDINGDGDVNNKDVVTLFRSLSRTDAYIDHDIYDINADGEIDNKDIVSLFRYISSMLKEKQNEETQPTGPEEESEPVSDETAEPQIDGITVTELTSPVGRNETATISIKGKPDTEYTIKVYYSTTASKANGLEKKTSDVEGLVSWSWKVGGSTNPGTFKIVITGGGEKLETEFTVE